MLNEIKNILIGINQETMYISAGKTSYEIVYFIIIFGIITSIIALKTSNNKEKK